jgi:hypothetical protein
MTGRREALRDFAVADPTGVAFVLPVISADGRWFAYNFSRVLSSLYVVDGLR